MRFPKLSHLFHKRSNSDGALARHARPVPSTARPVSASYADGIVLPGDYQPPFLPEIYGNPPGALLGVVPPISTSTMSSASAMHSTASHVSAAAHSVVVDVLTRRIQELEDAVRAYEDGPNVVAALEAELLALRNSLEEKTTENAKLEAGLASLRSEADGVQNELEDSRRHHDRLSRLMDIPVINSVIDRIPGGEDAEDALVDSIKEATKDPQSPWRRLLEPVTGPRSPETYIAQVNCTLRARKDGSDWRKKAGFWKYSAKEDGRHVNTVTPSVSQLSDLVKESSARISVMKTIPAAIEDLGTEFVESMPHQSAQGEDPAAVSRDSSSLSLQPVQSFSKMPLSSITEVADLAPPASAVVIPELETERPTSLHSNLPPLASVTFRECHSIRSLSSRRSGLISSSSTTSRLSRDSKSLKAADVPTFSESSSRNRNSVCVVPAAADTDIANTISGSGPIAAETVLQPTTVDAPTTPPRSTSTSEFAFLSNFINRSFSFASIMTTKSGDSKLPATTSVFPASPLSSSDAPGDVSAEPTSPRPVKAPASTAHVNTTPTKSRLPIPTALRKAKSASPASKLIRRLSRTISKPVLVDSTNAAAVGDSSPQKAVKASKTAMVSKSIGSARTMGWKMPKADKKDVEAKRVEGRPHAQTVGVRAGKEKENVSGLRRPMAAKSSTFGRKAGVT